MPALNRIKTGQKAVASTGVALAIGTTLKCPEGVIVQAMSTNAAPVFVGESTVTNQGGGTGNGYELQAGQSIAVPVADIALVYVNGTAADGVCWMVS